MNTIVRSFLIELARKKSNQIITYQKLSDACNLNLNMQEGDHVRAEIGRILGEISKYENSFQRPFLSALVVRVGDQLEGDGFYKLAEELGFGDWKHLKKEGVFEIEQIKKCIEFWSNNSNYIKYK